MTRTLVRVSGQWVAPAPMLEFPHMRHVRKGQVVSMPCEGGVANRPAPCDGLHITHRQDMPQFFPDGDLKAAGLRWKP